jgi:hydroxypyruvate reductase
MPLTAGVGALAAVDLAAGLPAVVVASRYGHRGNRRRSGHRVGGGSHRGVIASDATTPEILDRLLWAALAAVDPAAAVRRALAVRRDTVTFGGMLIPLRGMRRIVVVGAGKAAAPMARAVAELLSSQPVEGLVVVPYGYAEHAGPIEVREGGHPLPDAAGIAATAEIFELLATTDERDLVIALISGGGSALLVAPDDGVSLGDLVATNALLLRCGATIREINAVRKRLERAKGGGLARAAAPSTLIGLVVSDVVGSPLDVIASGPTVADTSTWADATSVIDRFDLWSALPAAVTARLRDGFGGRWEAESKPSDPAFASARSQVIVDNRVAALAAVQAARDAGMHAMLLTTFVEGEAREVGRALAGILREVNASGAPLPRPCVFVAGGETTVSVRGGGKGGRNQEVALGAAIALDGVPNVLFASVGLDGRDGPTDVAGAWADGATMQRARELGRDPFVALAENDSHRFFAEVGGHLRTGATLTNVNDLFLLVAL